MGVPLVGMVEVFSSGLGIAQLLGLSVADLGPICNSARETAVLGAAGQPCWRVPAYPVVSANRAVVGGPSGGPGSSALSRGLNPLTFAGPPRLHEAVFPSSVSQNPSFYLLG